MKTILTIIFLSLSLSACAQPVENLKTYASAKSRYYTGFEFYTGNGDKCTLLTWEDSGFGHWRWKCVYERNGITAVGWTNDNWIDLYIGKSFYDAQNLKIIPLDTLRKWYPDYDKRAKNYNHQ